GLRNPYVQLTDSNQIVATGEYVGDLGYGIFEYYNKHKYPIILKEDRLLISNVTRDKILRTFDLPGKPISHMLRVKKDEFKGLNSQFSHDMYVVVVCDTNPGQKLVVFGTKSFLEDSENLDYTPDLDRLVDLFEHIYTIETEAIDVSYILDPQFKFRPIVYVQKSDKKSFIGYDIEDGKQLDLLSFDKEVIVRKNNTRSNSFDVFDGNIYTSILTSSKLSVAGEDEITIFETQGKDDINLNDCIINSRPINNRNIRHNTGFFDGRTIYLDDNRKQLQNVTLTDLPLSWVLLPLEAGLYWQNAYSDDLEIKKILAGEFKTLTHLQDWNLSQNGYFFVYGENEGSYYLYSMFIQGIDMTFEPKLNVHLAHFQPTKQKPIGIAFVGENFLSKIRNNDGSLNTEQVKKFDHRYRNDTVYIYYENMCYTVPLNDISEKSRSVYSSYLKKDTTQ
ncbi:MAG: hypothetical protein KAH30_07285, partial [Caldisericia bacterium]|nr:hypothetical protein [Caldisericia bacterium]